MGSTKLTKKELEKICTSCPYQCELYLESDKPPYKCSDPHKRSKDIHYLRSYKAYYQSCDHFDITKILDEQQIEEQDITEALKKEASKIIKESGAKDLHEALMILHKKQKEKL